MVDRSRRVLTITKTKQFAAGVTGLEYQDALNSDNYLGAEPETLKIQDFSEDGPEVEANLVLWKSLYAVSDDPAEAWKGLLYALLRDPDWFRPPPCVRQRRRAPPPSPGKK